MIRPALRLIFQCHAGLHDACMAIRVNGGIIGYMMMGQFRTGDAVPRALRTSPAR